MPMLGGSDFDSRVFMRAADDNLGDGTFLNKSFMLTLSVLSISIKPSSSLGSLILSVGVFAFSNDLNAQSTW